MLDIMFELPDQPTGMKYVVNEEVVLGREKLFPIVEAKHKSARDMGLVNAKLTLEETPASPACGR